MSAGQKSQARPFRSQSPKRVGSLPAKLQRTGWWSREQESEAIRSHQRNSGVDVSQGQVHSTPFGPPHSSRSSS